jgi:DNA polymerase-3 subunit gamma/tau
METLGETLIEMREALDTRISLEVALVRIARPDADTTPAALLERIERLERGLSGHVTAPARSEAMQAAQAAAVPPTTAAPAAAPVPSAPAPAGPPAGSRPALGALRRTAASPPSSAGPPAAGPLPAGPPPAGPPPAGPPPAGPPPARPSAAPAASPVPAAAPSAEMPSRDDLTKAWGDGVLASLKPTVKARFAAGRFLANDDKGAVFAVPNAPHLSQCEPLRGEVEAALSRRFGRPVTMRLVVDSGEAGAAPFARDDADQDPDPGSVDFDALEDAPSAVASPEERLKQAFPGAEEVTP